MVHNGIEYGLMQATPRATSSCREGHGQRRARLQGLARGTVVRSWLLDLLVQALEHDQKLDAIRGYVEDSGEGRWTVEEAIDNAVPAPVITAALFARFASRQDDSPAMKAVAALRNQFGGHAVTGRRGQADSPPRTLTPAVHVAHLSLTDFRSYAAVELPLDPGVTALVGPNGQGKTNLVEALGYVATLGTHRVSTDAPLVRLGAERAVVRAAVVRDDRRRWSRSRSPRAGQPREGQPGSVPRARDVLGHPAHGPVRTGGPRAGQGRPGRAATVPRRPALARHPRFAGVRADYERVLKQRNALLKSAARAERRRAAATCGPSTCGTPTCDAPAPSCSPPAGAGRRARPAVDKAYAGGRAVRASGPPRSTTGRRWGRARADRSRPGPCSPSACCEAAPSAARSSTAACAWSARTATSCVLTLGPLPAKGYASHGESWSFALALRLAAYDLLTRDGGEPVLILDDVFAELDT